MYQKKIIPPDHSTKGNTKKETISAGSPECGDIHKSTLIKILHQQFPVTDMSGQFKELYPFCNEFGYAEVIKNLKHIGSNKTNKIKVALLFGESNFLSLLPFLEGVSDIILLADIQPALHRHNEFLLQCFKQSNTPQQFISCFIKDNPMVGEAYSAGKRYDIHLLKEQLSGSTSFSKSLGKNHFLYNQECFERCKLSLTKVKILQIGLNLVDDKACYQLALLLNSSDAILTFCNFTNIHNYVDKNELSISTHALLKDNLEDCMIMFSYGSFQRLRAFCTVGLTNYLTTPKNQIIDDNTNRMTILRQNFETQKNALLGLCNRNSLFFQKSKVHDNQKPIERCYVGFYLDYKLLGKEDIKKYMDGTSNSIDYFNMHAFDTEQEAEDYVLSRFFNKSNQSLSENSWWIFIINGNKDKINRLLRCMDDENELTHFPSDILEAGLKFYPRIIKAINNTKTIIIENDEHKPYSSDYNFVM